MPNALLPKAIVALLPALLYACSEIPSKPPPGTVQRTSPRVQAAPPAPAGVTAPPPAAYAAPAPAPARSGGGLALLLPLSGAYSAAAESVRDGFVSAYFGDAAHARLRVYDIGATVDTLRAAYQQALNDGAGFIVGPLRKEDVTALAGFVPPVPVLALNYLDAGVAAPFNFFQLGVAPEDEARAAARQALALGQRRAVALVPDADWGARVLAAFDETLRANGGAVVRSQRYAQGAIDVSKTIADLMGVSASEDRHKALTAVLGEKSEFESARRGDIDLVFLAARPQDAQLLIPQLRFNRAGDLPIYATALIYDGKPGGDLNGLRFCDAPWLIGQSDALSAQRSAANGLSTATPRLFALGRDAYTLAAGLQRGALRVGDAIDGASGRLEWRDRSVVGRSLECAQINGDGLRALSMAGAPPSSP
ncbi:penicillin-binding protein activator [Solimonas soli]|uniref:penicillin-binding protein activator n=1 Tax=Solimonas soli TaxID=413479 RepID=UPI00146FB904|nr:penicillin-binding protein activator [Solimonas soli]